MCDNFDPETSYVILALSQKCLEATVHSGDQILIWGDGSPMRESFYIEDRVEVTLGIHTND